MVLRLRTELSVWVGTSWHGSPVLPLIAYERFSGAGTNSVILHLALRTSSKEIDGCSCVAREMTVSWFKKSKSLQRDSFYNKLI